MNREEKKKLRGLLFLHLDGIAIAPTVSALYKGGIINYILNNPHFTFKKISKKFKTNNGYLNVALRLFASQGWMTRNILIDGEEIDYILTKKGQIALSLSSKYASLDQYMPILINMDNYLFNREENKYNKIFSKLIIDLKKIRSNKINQEELEWEVIKHIEGLVVGPILVTIGMSDLLREMLETGGEIQDKIMTDFPLLKSVFDYFIILGWIKNNRFTDEGHFFMKRSSAYGVTVSYLPTFMQIPDLIFGNPNKIWKRTKNDLETHVNRRMNVWGSGGAHTLYFRKIDDIVTSLFNQPLKDQPIGIADMGCGDGTLLKHLYNVVKNNTLRGKYLGKYPLIIIGADYNKAARLASSITLKDAGIKYSILSGDISDPHSYAQNLKEKFGLDLLQMLNVRSFLDHNRIYSRPILSFHERKCNSTGAFAFRGRWIPNNELKQNLVEHFSSWRNYISKFGLLVLELHTINPTITASNLGNTAATAYDGTHGYSDQYIFEIDTMLSAANEAGLMTEPQYQAQYPNNNLATISINLFKVEKK